MQETCTCEQVAGVVFFDLNEDGCQAAPADGVEGVTVELVVCNADGTTTVVTSTSTAADGSYAFGGINPDTGACWLDPAMMYATQISNLPTGYTGTTGDADADADGTIDCVGDDDDSPANNGSSACYDPADDDGGDGDADEHIDFGIVLACPSDNCAQIAITQN